MSKLSVIAAGLLSTFVLASCSSEYEAPDKYKVKSAMTEWADGEVIDDLRKLSCDNLGKGKFYCSFEISYIGSQPEQMEKCFFSSASEITIRSNSSCY